MRLNDNQRVTEEIKILQTKMEIHPNLFDTPKVVLKGEIYSYKSLHIKKQISNKQLKFTPEETGKETKPKDSRRK